MNKYLFVDLDDTIFQTRRKCGDNEGLSPAAVTRDGAPIGFMTRQQQEIFAFLDAETIIIPATGRNLDAFSRVSLAFRHCVILNFGGIVLTPECYPDMDWLDRMKVENQKIGQRLMEIFLELEEFIAKEDLSVSARIVGDFGLEFYIVVKRRADDQGQLDCVHDRFFLRHHNNDTYIHYNDNNLCLLPGYLNKRYAVEYVIDKYIASHGDAFLTMGMGDSTSDLGFMAACDYMITPSTSQIRKSRFFENDSLGL